MQEAQKAQESSTTGLGFIIALNLIPLVGVFSWGWQSFDLIFLYWMENLVIGVFTFARMVVRPYGSGLTLIFPFFLAPFFLLHYGGFCWGHGTFVVALFGPESMNGFELLPALINMLSSELMLVALIALAAIQALDWTRDVREHGFGADSAIALMFHPYRRIMVLHITILGAGFALTALHEPLIGLVVLVLVKTASDVWHWRKAGILSKPMELSAETLAELVEQYPEPKITVNGVDKKFASFTEMANSPEMRMASSMLKLIGVGSQMKALTTYMNMKVEQERLAQASDPTNPDQTDWTAGQHNA